MMPKRRRHRRWVCIAIPILVVLIVAIVVPVVVVVGDENDSDSSGNTTAIVTAVTTVAKTSLTIATSTTVVTSTVATSTASPTSTESYLGGFDTVLNSGNYYSLFYTDQEGNLRHIYSGGTTWDEASPNIVASGVKPGSPIQAIYTGSPYSTVYVFYVGNDNVLRAVTTSEMTPSSASWNADSIGNLNLTVSNSLFIRTCTPATSSYYSDNPDIYLYFRSPQGQIVQYGGWQDSAEMTWEPLGRESPVEDSVGVVECNIDVGVESLWVITPNYMLEEWYRNTTASNDSWHKGIVYSTTVHPNTSLLTVTAGDSSNYGRTHLFYQDTDLNLRRIDIDGRGPSAHIDSEEILTDGTPGTRLTTWAERDYCETEVDVYYQKDNTSALHYLTFVDTDYVSAGHSVTVTDGDTLMPIVETWGKKVDPADQDDGGSSGPGSGAIQLPPANDFASSRMSMRLPVSNLLKTHFLTRGLLPARSCLVLKSASTYRANPASSTATIASANPSEMATAPTYSRALGALLGVHAGDALGASFEFRSWADIHALHPHGQREILGGGAFGWPAGHATDDTDLTRAVLLAYRDCRTGTGLAQSGGGAGWSDEVATVAAEHMLRWRDGEWPDRAPGSRPVDIGRATEVGLERYQRSRDPSKAGAGHGQAGNGSLMRCVATALLQLDREKRIRESQAISAITHDDERCTVSCAAYNEMVAALVAGKSATEAVEDGLAVARELSRDVEDAIVRGKGLKPADLAENGPQALVGKGGGYVLESLILAVAAVLDSRPLVDVLVDIVRVGKDTDSNAAIAGGLLGARDGVQAIPDDWVQKLQFAEEFRTVLASLLT
ncbi:ADP-ribosylglycohydrolase-domain-containing protein [Lineolata rhizophorae]|uniref:ADP-ribosylhydrolase ARH3 n=1 Tax=Lineolata rhizophorae TaxID=578093 RepID=A0A6A6PE64_9PEZI|nr:ADP-ribosylglycohydrolase-domain-containing protein [Lineolata rhizophorae]